MAKLRRIRNSWYNTYQVPHGRIQARKRHPETIYMILFVSIIIVGEMICEANGFSLLGQFRTLALICWDQVIHPAWYFLFGV